MKKEQASVKLKTSFTFSAEAIYLLEKLAQKNRRSKASMLEELIRKQAEIELT